MAKDYLTLGSTPSDEDCAQVGSEDYHSRMRQETKRYIELLRRIFGPEPTGNRFAVKSFPHDFGSYHEVVIWYESDDPTSVEYAFRVENNLPEHWE